MDKTANEPRRQWRLEQYRHLARLQLARTQAGQRPPGRIVADGFGRRQVARVTLAGVPVVALHVLALAGNRRARKIVARRGVAADKTQAVGGNKMRLLHRYRGPFGVGDHRADIERRLLATAGQFDGVFDR